MKTNRVYDKSAIRFGNKRKSEAELKRRGRRQERARGSQALNQILHQFKY